MSNSSRCTEGRCFTIPIDKVQFREEHIRKAPFSVDSLKVTIADAGLLQPILVCRTGDDTYEVVDGARRLAALRELGVQELIVGRDIVIDVEEREADFRFKQLIANVQREDLNAIELGQVFVVLKEAYGYQYNEIADIIGKTPHFVAAKVGLIKRLDPEVRQRYLDDIDSGKCIQNTLSPDAASDGIACQPYRPNVNVLEDIARLPHDVQPIAYEEIKSCQMDKERALDFLRELKNASGEAVPLVRDRQTSATGTLSPSRLHDETAGSTQAHNIRNQIDKITRDLEGLMDCMRGSNIVDREIIAEIESMIRQLGSLCTKVKAIEGDGDGKILATPGIES
jgi:ParB-like partition proteins